MPRFKTTLKVSNKKPKPLRKHESRRKRFGQLKAGDLFKFDNEFYLAMPTRLKGANGLPSVYKLDNESLAWFETQDLVTPVDAREIVKARERDDRSAMRAMGAKRMLADIKDAEPKTRAECREAMEMGECAT